MLERDANHVSLIPWTSGCSEMNPVSEELVKAETDHHRIPKPPIKNRRRTSTTGKWSPDQSDQSDNAMFSQQFRRRLLARRSSAPEVTFGLPPIKSKLIHQKSSIDNSFSNSKFSFDQLESSLKDVTDSSVSHVTRNGRVDSTIGNESKDFQGLDGNNNKLNQPTTVAKVNSKKILKIGRRNSQSLLPLPNALAKQRAHLALRRQSLSPTLLSKDITAFNERLTSSTMKYGEKYGKDHQMNGYSKDKNVAERSQEIVNTTRGNEADDVIVDEEFNNRILCWITEVDNARRNPFSLLSDDEDDGVAKETAIRIIHTGDK